MMTNPNALQFINEQEEWGQAVARYIKLLNEPNGRRSTQQCRELGDLMVRVKAKYHPNIPLKYWIQSIGNGISMGYALKLYNEALHRDQP